MRHPGRSSSERAAALLRESGYQAQALAGGFPAWEAGEYPVER
jgi:rhodanese-related sulfurtransferase